jgi:O-antigen/teichoic acid export membrane protein
MITSMPPAGAFDVPPARSLLRTGMALLPAALIQEATIFISAATLASVASAAALGSAEAARIVARPVQAFSLGISRSLAPRLMEAGEARSRSRARRVVFLYVAAIAGAGLVYLAVAGWSYSLSPFVEVVPVAYAKEGLVALFLVATLAGAITQVPRGVLLGAGRGKELLLITVLASLCRIAAVALLAASMGAYALPVAHLLSLALGGALGIRATGRLLDRP